MRKLVIGSRGSQLALRQSKLLELAIEKHHPDLEVSTAVIRTSGDKLPHTALSKLTTSVKGLFVKEIEEALLEQRIDVAVHSLKDLPTDLPEGLTLAAIPEREDPRDALVTRGRAIRARRSLRGLGRSRSR